jgi:hypothetical protein
VSGLEALLWLALRGVGPDGSVLAEDLRALEGPPLVLPVESLAETAETLWLIPHGEKSGIFALYAGPEDPSSGRFFDLAEESTPDPGIPRLVLHTVYLEGADGLENLPVDLSENLYSALLEARLEAVALPGTAYGERVGRRAAALFDEVPAEHRRGAYLVAVRDFGSHLLSIAHEVRRAAVRAGARGIAPCVLLERRVPLLKLWERSLREGRYTGNYPRPAAAESTEAQGMAAFRVDWPETQRGLEADDKRAFLKEILDIEWRGDMEHDFAELCP